MRFPFKAAVFGLMIAGAAAVVTAASAGNAGIDKGRSVSAVVGPSGLPVPRFVELRKDEVHARFGPSFDYPVAYEFYRRGLPLKVIAEDRDNIWRRVEDHDGHRMWIHRSMLSANAHAVVISEDAILRSGPDAEARGRARLSGGVMARLESCQQDWCRVRTAEYRGWLPRSELWGAPL